MVRRPVLSINLRRGNNSGTTNNYLIPLVISRVWICLSSRWGSWRRRGRSCARRGRRHSPSAQHEGTQHQVPYSPPVHIILHHNSYRPISPVLVVAVTRVQITIKTPNPKYVVTGVVELFCRPYSAGLLSFTLCFWPDSEPTKLLHHTKQKWLVKSDI